MATADILNMENTENMYNMVGETVEVFTDSTRREVKEITIKEVTKTASTWIFIDTNGGFWTENDINWIYRATPEYLLYDSLITSSIIDIDTEFNFNKFHIAFQTFMESMVKSGYVDKA